MFDLAKYQRDRGNVSFLRKPDNGLVPYKADAEILKSCDIMFPLRINLLGMRELADLLRHEMSKKDSEIELRLIHYIAPYEPVNCEIMSLLTQCQSASPIATLKEMNHKRRLEKFVVMNC